MYVVGQTPIFGPVSLAQCNRSGWYWAISSAHAKATRASGFARPFSARISVMYCVMTSWKAIPTSRMRLRSRSVSAAVIAACSSGSKSPECSNLHSRGHVMYVWSVLRSMMMSVSAAVASGSDSRSRSVLAMGMLLL